MILQNVGILHNYIHAVTTKKTMMHIFLPLKPKTLQCYIFNGWITTPQFNRGMAAHVG